MILGIIIGAYLVIALGVFIGLHIEYQSTAHTVMDAVAALLWPLLLLFRIGIKIGG